jgi:hypothetical protein
VLRRGILFSSGLVGREGLMGVALWAFYFDKPTGVGLIWPEPAGELVALALFALMGYLLFRRAQ